MFTPVPPQGVPSGSPKPESAVESAAPLRESVAHRVLSFGFRRGALAGLALGGILGLCAGLFLPDGVMPFNSQRLHQDRLFFDDLAGVFDRFTMVQTWVIVTIVAVTPLMIGLFSFAKAVEVVVESMARSARRTERTMQRALQQRFDTHL